MPRRLGDSVDIPGDYQYKALHSGHAVQRFWHFGKTLAITRELPPQPGDTVLDVGCGSGVIAGFLGSAGADVLGIDANPDAIAFANRTFAARNVRFQVGFVDDAFPLDRPADKIYCLEVIEHIHREQAVEMLRSFNSLLRPGGCVLLTTPNYRSLWPVVETLMDFFNLAPRMEGHQHVERYTRAKLQRVADESGLSLRSLRTTHFVAPWLSPLSWSLAERTEGLESRLDVGLGSILVAVLEKPSKCQPGE